jgi:predicted ATPase/DNA-binding SARP family transcriptional activator
LPPARYWSIYGGGVHLPDGHQIEFRLLGRIEAVRNGETLALGGPRQRALLALFLIEPGASVSAERLADELWHGRPPAGASTTIRSYVSRLRSVLGPGAPIATAARGYSLGVSAELVDLKRFERLVREGEEALARGSARRAAARLRGALGLWRGPPFSGAGDEGVLQREAQRLDALRLFALEERVAADLALGADAELVPELQALLRDHPYRERFWQHLMLALYRAGRQADALAAYRRARAILDRDLGLEPTEDLRRLEQAILVHEVPPVQRPEQRHNLPAPVTSFIGRASELAELERLLAENRIITLTGVGGVGKTRLASEAAARAVPDMRDGVVFVDFAGIAQPPLVPRHVARALELREDPDRPTGEQLAARLRDADVLLLFDNCEHLREACADFARTLLAACPRLRILATSREPLGVPGEVDYAVPPLGVPALDSDHEEFGSSEAVRLFVVRAREARPRLVDDPAAGATVARICRDLDGLPLAIELAAARAKALSLAEIADRLADRFGFLVARRRLTAARHRTLEEAMDWSYDLLGAEEQRLLARLSVFAGGFSLGAAAAVCLESDEDRALALIEGLVDASLVVAEERDGAMRYRLLETLRRYAAERLESSGDTGDVRRRHAEFVLALAEDAEDGLRQSVESRWGARLHAEYGNVTAALAWSVETGSVEVGLRIAAALARFWIERDYATDADRWLGRLLQDACGTSPALRAKASLAAWNVASVRGDAVRAERYAQHAVELYRAAADDEGSPGVLLALGALHEQRGEYAEGRRRLEKALVLQRSAGDEPGLRRSLQLLGNIARETGDVEQARRLLGEALVLTRAARDPFHEAGVLHSLGDTELEDGDLDAAEVVYLQALEIARRIRGHRIACYCIAGLSAATATRGDGAAAAHLWSAARVLEHDLRFRMRPTARNRYERRLAAVGDSDAPEVFADCRNAEAVVEAAMRAVQHRTTVA